MAVTKTPVILTHFENLTDPRVERTKKHALSDLVAIALCGAICGADTWADVERFGNEKIDWLGTFLRLEHGIPSHDTFGRVFAMLDTSEFFACLATWIASLQLDLKGRVVAIDGRAPTEGWSAPQIVRSRPGPGCVARGHRLGERAAAVAGAVGDG